MVFKLGIFAEVDGSSTSFCKTEVEGLSQSVASIDIRCLKDFDFLATDLVRGEDGEGNGGGPMSDGCGL